MTLRGDSPQAALSDAAEGDVPPLATLEQSTAALQLLLSGFDGAAERDDGVPAANERPGVRSMEAARTLFAAIRHKHAPTAAHSWRVALGSSSWGLAAGLQDAVRGDLEIAALLHDVGKLARPIVCCCSPAPWQATTQN